VQAVVKWSAKENGFARTPSQLISTSREQSGSSIAMRDGSKPPGIAFRRLPDAVRARESTRRSPSSQGKAIPVVNRVVEYPTSTPRSLVGLVFAFRRSIPRSDHSFQQFVCLDSWLASSPKTFMSESAANSVPHHRVRFPFESAVATVWRLHLGIARDDQRYLGMRRKPKLERQSVSTTIDGILRIVPFFSTWKTCPPAGNLVWWRGMVVIVSHDSRSP